MATNVSDGIVPELIGGALASDTLNLSIEAGTDRPKPEWVRGVCPQCGEELVSNCYYVGSKGFLVVWECWGSLSKNPVCSYRKVL